MNKVILTVVFLSLIGGYALTHGRKSVKCSTSHCLKSIDMSSLNLLKRKFYSLMHGGVFDAVILCPEHKERVTAGKFNDGDPSTNPDLASNNEVGKLVDYRY